MFESPLCLIYLSVPISPATSKVYTGVVVPIPKSPTDVIRALSIPLDASNTKAPPVVEIPPLTIPVS